MTVFQPFRSSISESPILTTITGTSTTISHSGYIKVFFQNLAGVNLGSIATQFNIVAGQGIRISIPATMVKSGELPEYYIIGCSFTGNIGTYVQIAKIKALSPSGNLIPLPLSVDINSDNSFNLNLTSINYSSLPVNVSLGKLAIDLETGTYFQKELTEWIPFWKGNTFLIEPNSIDTTGGYLQPSLSLINYTEDITYEGNGQFSRNFYIGYLNDSSFSIPANTLIGLAVLINGSPSSSLAGRLEIRMRGYVSLSSGLLDTAPATGYPTLIWEADKDSSFIIPNELLSQSVALFSVRFSYSDSELSTINPNSTIALDLFLYNEGSVKAEFGSFTGNFIVDIENNLEVTPNVGLSLNINSGQVLINRRISSIKLSQIISGLLSNTVNQKLIIDVELNARIEQNTYIKNVREEILAIIGTSPYEHIANLSATINLSSIGGIEINLVNYVGTSKIRNTYPDKYIAGKVTNYNVKKINIYLVQGANIYKYTIDAILFSTQNIVINSLPATTLVLPTNTDNTKGLFELESFTLIATTGTIPANSYTVYVSYEWLGDSITKIEMESSFLTVKVNSGTNLFSGSPKFDVLKLRNINYDPITDIQEIAIYNKNNELYKRKENNAIAELLGSGSSLGSTSYPLGLEFNFASVTNSNNNTGELRFDFDDLTPVYDNLRLNEIFYIHVSYSDSPNARNENTSNDQTEYLLDAAKAYLVQVNNNTNGTYATFRNYTPIYNVSSITFDVVLISGKLEVNAGDDLIFQWSHKYSGNFLITQAYSTSFIPNLSNGATFFKIDLSGNIIIAAPFGAIIGQEWEIYLKQDATGGRTITLNSVYISGSPIILSTNPNVFDILKFKCVATDLYAVWFKFKYFTPQLTGGFTPLHTSLEKLTGQSVSANTTVDITFSNPPIVDENGIWNFASSQTRLTIVTNGLYDIKGFVQLLNNAGTYVFRLVKNGAIIETRQFSNVSAGFNGNNELNKTLFLNAGDYIELRLFSSIAQTVSVGTTFSVTRLK
jgi:hypothetical protein